MLLHEGKYYARVSEILKPYTDFGHIEPEVLQRKANLGTRVHEAIKLELEGEMPVLDSRECGYFRSWSKWKEAINPEFVEIEQRHFCEEKKLTGCIDALIKMPGEKQLTLTDWKTSAVESPMTWPMQAHRYYHLIANSPRVLSHRFLFVKLDRHGDLPQVFQYKFDKNLYGFCLAAVDDFWKMNPETVDNKSQTNV